MNIRQNIQFFYQKAVLDKNNNLSKITAQVVLKICICTIEYQYVSFFLVLSYSLSKYILIEKK